MVIRCMYHKVIGATIEGPTCENANEARYYWWRKYQRRWDVEWVVPTPMDECQQCDGAILLAGETLDGLKAVKDYVSIQERRALNLGILGWVFVVDWDTSDRMEPKPHLS